MPAQGTDLILIERGGVLYRLTAEEVAALAPAGGGGGSSNRNGLSLALNQNLPPY